MKYTFFAGILGGICLGILTGYIIVLAKNDFIWYRDHAAVNAVQTSPEVTYLEILASENAQSIALIKTLQEKTKNAEEKAFYEGELTRLTMEQGSIATWYALWFEQPLPESTNISVPDITPGALLAQYESAIFLSAIMLRAYAHEELKTFSEDVITSRNAQGEIIKTLILKK